MNEDTYLRIPAFTIERTAAFMPALSPPDVNTAIFIFQVLMIAGGVEEYF